MGLSAGGPYALGCAYKLPERVLAGAVVSTGAPLDRPNPCEGLSSQQRTFVFVARYMRPLIYLTKQTRSATVLATATLVGLLPQVVLEPYIGTLVDRWNRRVMMLLADSVIALATLVLAYLFAIGGFRSGRSIC